MKAYRLLDLDTHDVLFYTHVQFDEQLVPYDAFPPLSFSYALDPLDPIIISHSKEHFDSNSDSNFKAPVPIYTMPSWAHITLEEATPFIQDLPPSQCTPLTSTALIHHTISGDAHTISQDHGI